MSGVLELSLIFLVVGAKGFTRRGLPFSARRRIRGGRGRIVGSLCLLVGILGIAFAFWASPPADRQAIRSLCYGVVAGILGTCLVLEFPRFEEDEPVTDRITDAP